MSHSTSTSSCQLAKESIIRDLEDIIQRLSEAINGFSDPADVCALLDAEQLILDLAIRHDEAGQYGVFFACEECSEGDLE